MSQYSLNDETVGLNNVNKSYLHVNKRKSTKGKAENDLFKSSKSNQQQVLQSPINDFIPFELSFNHTYDLFNSFEHFRSNLVSGFVQKLFVGFDASGLCVVVRLGQFIESILKPETGKTNNDRRVSFTHFLKHELHNIS